MKKFFNNPSSKSDTISVNIPITPMLCTIADFYEHDSKLRIMVSADDCPEFSNNIDDAVKNSAFHKKPILV